MLGEMHFYNLRVKTLADLRNFKYFLRERGTNIGEYDCYVYIRKEDWEDFCDNFKKTVPWASVDGKQKIFIVPKHTILMGFRICQDF